VRNEKVLHGVTEERNFLRPIERRRDRRIGHSWRGNCLLKHCIEGKIQGRIEVTERRGIYVSSYWMNFRIRVANVN